ncbi:neutral zinc metallopeptidase [Cyanothece sp. BG0011]|uniref:neutral zinc metallopeptidase n=1 Tax=Cyanothece sp. BG0011 TaxID=2082950 RepID=UPI000D1F6491|nr:neutral zinc metallopeptidase [Cyanothece sp. BG0011]
MKKQVALSILALSLGLFPFQPTQAAWDPPTLSAVSNGLDAFWGGILTRLGIRYTYPMVYSHQNLELTPCGPSLLAHYCADSNTIHLNMVQMDKLVETVGDSAGFFALAHEYGHSVQKHLGILDKNLPIVVLELQADCLAGAFFAATDELGILEPGDVKEGAITAMMTGDYDYEHTHHHGTPEQRGRAFLSGFNDPKSCFQ